MSISLFFISLTAFAEWADLTCINDKKDHSIKVSFNEKKHIVNYKNTFHRSRSSLSNLPAIISDDEIKFWFNDNEKKSSYDHIIDRNSGLMHIQGTGNAAGLSLIYHCKSTKQKF